MKYHWLPTLSFCFQRGGDSKLNTNLMYDLKEATFMELFISPRANFIAVISQKQNSKNVETFPT